jgi:flagellar protein FliS
MLYDGLLRFIHEARNGFNEESYIRRNEIVNNNILRAQRIVVELQVSLDMKVGGDFSETMYRLYDFVHDQLRDANVKKDASLLESSEKVVHELRDAWAEMLRQQESPSMTHA